MSPVWRALVGALLAFVVVLPDISSVERAAAGIGVVFCVPFVRRRPALFVAGAVLGALAGLRVDAEVERGRVWSAAETVCVVRFVASGDDVWDVRLGHPDVGVVAARLRKVPDGVRAGDVWRLPVRCSPMPRARNPDDRRALRSALARGALVRARVVGDGVRLARGAGTGPAVAIRAAASAAWRDHLRGSAGLWTALLLADRDGLHAEATRRVQRLGFAHLLALSGLHVGVVMGLLALGLTRLGRWGPVAAIPLLVAWTVLAGAGPSMTRAVAMVGFVIVGRIARRHVRLDDTLAVCALLELAWRPAVLGGVGWWLSYGATLAILRVLPALKGRPWIVQGLAVSVVAQLGTLPWILDTFGRLPLLAPITLLVIGPVFSAVLAVGGAAAVLALGAVPGAAGIAQAGAHLFGILLHAARATGALAWSHPGFDDRSWALLLLLWAVWIVPRDRVPLRAPALATACAFVAVHVPLIVGPRHTWISFDVGQGDGGVYRCGSRTLIVDTGPGTADWRPVERSILPWIERRALRDVSIVLTHGHLDHFAGTRRLVRTGRVGTLMIADCDRDDDWARGFAALADSFDVTMTWVARGDVLWDDCCRARVLWPPAGSAARAQHHDANDRSVVLELGPEHAPLLATGDLERAGEREVVAALRDADAPWILKVAHHGGDTGTDPPLLETLRPRLALISCGHGNRYGHPRAVVLDRLGAAGTPFLRTDLTGAITVRWTRQGIVVETAGGGP